MEKYPFADLVIGARVIFFGHALSVPKPLARLLTKLYSPAAYLSNALIWRRSQDFHLASDPRDIDHHLKFTLGFVRQRAADEGLLDGSERMLVAVIGLREHMMCAHFLVGLYKLF